MTLPLDPGKFRVFTDQPMPVPDMNIDVLGLPRKETSSIRVSAFPNPFVYSTMLSFSASSEVSPRVQITDLTGKVIKTFTVLPSVSGNYNIEWNGETHTGKRAEAGCYLYQISSGDSLSAGKLILGTE
jgi:hypothetical protein